MEDSPTVAAAYPWGQRAIYTSEGESVLPRDSSLADIAPWTAPAPEPQQQQLSASAGAPKRPFGLSSFSSSSRLRHGSNVGANVLSNSTSRRRRGDSDASQPEPGPNNSSNDTFDANPQKAGKSSFLNFIKKKASRPAFAHEGYGSATSIAFDPNEFGIGSSSSTINFASSSSFNLSNSPSTSADTLLRPPQSKRARKASTKTKLSIPAPVQDSYTPLDLNELDMEGIVDTSRVGNGSSMPFPTYESPIDIARQPWDIPVNQNHSANDVNGSGPSGSYSQGYGMTHGSPTSPGVNGTPFSTLNPFNASPPSNNMLRNGKGRPLAISISPKEKFPSHSTSGGPFDLSTYAIPEHASPYSIPPSASTPKPHTSSHYYSHNSSRTPQPNAPHFPPHQFPHASTSASATQSPQYSPLQSPISQPTSANWQAPDSWATIPRENPDALGGESSDDEDLGNTISHRPSFTSPFSVSTPQSQSQSQPLTHQNGNPFMKRDANGIGGSPAHSGPGLGPGANTGAGTGSGGFDTAGTSSAAGVLAYKTANANAKGNANGRPGTGSTRPGTGETSNSNASGIALGGAAMYASGSRTREKSLPQTPMSAGLDVGFNRPAQASVRIYRSDGKYHVVNCPPTTTVAQMRNALTKKLGIKGETHRLYMREKGRQRALGLHQAPALILHRRLEQAGYTISDELDAMGGEDLGFLVRFIFKNASLGAVEVDEDSFPSGFEHIELAERDLETVPIVLHRHAAQIVTLNLSKNPLVDLPQDFVTDCLQLRELRLTNVAMKRLPRAVRQIKSLQWLDISCNRILDLDHAGLEQIPGLRQIFVQNNRLTNLPPSFVHMLSLKYLNISNNKFDEIPPVICEMPNLVDLDVSFNSISILPPGLGRLIALERLIIVGNQIREFPPEVKLMISLRELDCRRNLISDLSPLSGLPRLESLLAEHNTVNTLDFVVGPKLVTLNTSHNRTARSTLRPLLPNTRFSLTTLDLSHLKLSSFDEDGAAFGAFTSLITLKLDYNEIRAIPEIICTLSELELISCTNNDLHSLPTDIGKLRKLRVFNVHNNNIKVVPESIWDCESLTELNMSSNSLEGWMDPPIPPPPIASSSTSLLVPINGGVDDDYDFVDIGPNSERKGSTAGHSFTARATGGSAGSVPPLASSLQRLLLADNYLGVTSRTNTFDFSRTLTYMRELRVLNLSFNQLTELPPLHHPGFAQLIELYLSGNNLTSLPGETIQKLTKLKVLHLNGNKLQTLPAELGKVAGLETLDVGNNQLKYNVLNWQYDWNWNFNSQLKYLNLSGNKRLEIKNMQQALTTTAAATASHPLHTTPRLFDFADLLKLRVLGLMDITLRGASVPDESVERRVRTTETEINGMAYGIADTLGSVDGPMTFDLALQKFRGRDNESLFGLFGRTQPNLSANRAAKYLQGEFPRMFTDMLAKSFDKSGRAETEDVPEALRNTFLNLNRTLHEHLVMREDKSGRKLSTISMSGPVGNDLKGGASGIAIYIVDRPQAKMMYVANVGDMLAVVTQSNGGFTPVSSKHDPFERTEIVRIRAAEGWVSPKGMVNEEEDLSRNFGLYHLLPAVNARPDIHPHVLSDLDEFVIVGNRGLWDYISYRTAVDIARLNREDPMKAAQMLRDYAMAYGADGNTVIMVIAVGDLFPGGGRSRNAQDEGGYAPARRTGPRPERDRLLRMLDEQVTPPSGLLALVFTDIRNSTSLWEKNVGMPLAMRAHNELLRRQARWIGGYEVKTEGDSFMMAFQTMPAALLWCFKVQTELLQADWPMEILESEEGQEIFDEDGNVIARGLSVRMGIHWGKPVCAEDPTTHRMDYFGPMVNRSARIMAQALGGQIMVSSDVVREVERMTTEKLEENHPSLQHIDALKKMGIQVIQVGERSLKGLEAPEALALALPTALLGRMETPNTPAPAASSRIQFSLDQLMELNHLTVRLEALATNRVFKANPTRSPAPSPSGPATAASDAPPAFISDTTTTTPLEANPIIWRGDADVIMPRFKADPSDQDLMLLLDHISGRIENALSTLQIRLMMQPGSSSGPPPRLEDIDPRALAEAIRYIRLNPSIIR